MKKTYKEFSRAAYEAAFAKEAESFSSKKKKTGSCNQHQAEIHRLHAQGDNEGMQAGLVDHEAVDRADQGAGVFADFFLLLGDLAADFGRQFARGVADTLLHVALGGGAARRARGENIVDIEITVGNVLANDAVQTINELVAFVGL